MEASVPDKFKSKADFFTLKGQDRESNVISVKNCNIKNVVLENNQNIHVFFQNVQYISNKVDLVNDFIDEIRPEVICISEHGLKTVEISQLNLHKEYKLVSSFCRPKKKGGGVAIYGKNSIKMEQINVTEFCEESFEVAAGMIKQENGKMIVICVYRPPKSKLEDFLVKLRDLIENIRPEENVVIAGDFNIDLDVIDKNSTNFLDVMKSGGLRPTIFEPTRVTADSETRIDNLFTNYNMLKCNSTVFINELSDHRGTMLGMKCNPKLNESMGRWTRKYDDHHLQIFRVSLENAILANHSSANDANKMLSLVQTLHELYFPLNYKKVNVSRNIVNKKDRANYYKTLNELTSLAINLKKEVNIDKQEYSDIRKKIKFHKQDFKNKLISQKAKHIQNRIDTSENKAKTSWKFVNEHREQKSRNSDINSIKINDLVIEDPLQIANSLNSFFVSVTSNNSTLWKKEDLSYLKEYEEGFYFNPVSSDRIGKAIDRLKNKYSESADGLSNTFLKKIKKEITPLLTYCVNSFLVNAIFPDDLKVVKIMSLLKDGDEQDPNNYRPLAIVSPLSKIFEMVMCDQINYYLKCKNILYEHQYGFRRGMSTETAMRKCHETLTAASDMKSVVVAIDLRKAFDSVNLSILQYKLKKIGFGKLARKCLKSYLEGRRQFVQVGRGKKIIKSILQYILSGVPQGSVLGPLLFLLFINDLEMYVKKNVDGEKMKSLFKLILFADDLMLIVRNKCSKELEVDTFILVSLIQQWCNINLLKINEIKTKLLLVGFGRINLRNEFSLLLNDQIIEQVDLLKYLGVWIDSRLNFNEHVTRCCSKLNSAIFVLRTLANYCSISVLINVYYAIVFSHIKYCISIWSNSNVDQINKVFMAQKRAIRAIFQLKKRDSCKEYFVKFEIMTVPALIIYTLVCHFQSSINTTLQPEREIGPSTRNTIVTEKIKNNKLLNKGKKIFEKLPLVLRKKMKNQDFKKSLQNYLVETCPYDVNVNS